MYRSLLLFFTFLTFCFSSAYSQASDYEGGESFRIQNPLRIGVNAGVGMGNMRFAPGVNSRFQSSFLETTGSYALSPRMGIIMGLGYSRANFLMHSLSPDQQMPANIFQENYFFSGGAYYHVNERLTVSGMGQYGIPANNSMHNSISPLWNTKSFDVNALYKISDKVSIGAGFRYSEGNFGNGFGNQFMSPFMNPYGTPFGSPFRQGYSNF
ncbi:hypothetical protein BH23BAC1_BH23BAC1_46000 [soil metagenome]